MNYSQALKILGFKEDENPKEMDIKKVYRKMLLKHHPDKGGTTENFHIISKAYNILMGQEKAEEPILPPMNKTDEMFSEVFQGFDNIFSKMSGRKMKQTKKKRVRISVHELFNGATRNIEFIIGNICQDCHGTKTKSKTKCPECSGSGYEFINRKHSLGGPPLIKVSCKKCRGKGAIGRGSTQMCGSCSGKGIKYEKTTKSLRIPRSIKHNSRIITGENTETPIELIIQQPNQIDKDWLGWRLNDETRNIEIDYDITLQDALFGSTHSIPHPNGKNIELVTPPSIQPRTKIVFKDKGLPSCPELKMPPTHSIITINIKIPKIPEEYVGEAKDIFNKITQHGVS